MAGGKVSTVAKPQIRSLLRTQIKLNLIVALGMCTVAAVAMKVLYNDKRKEAYANFYKNYDINKEFEKMRAKGLFDSC
ncbi:cytochrome c oxidase subunit 6C-like [Euwallacea fornicatus]|uniref:cytochrome c oxidase subunit 6C-like n=1 Tax=Euwallacea fornicatus TaxID=995702 RepID=UPI00338EF44F